MTDLDVETRLQRAWSDRCEGSLDEAAARYDELLDLPADAVDLGSRSRALSGRAQVHRDRGQASEAVELLDEAIRLARNHDDAGLAHALRHAAEARLELAPPEPSDAVTMALEALELLRSLGANGLGLANAWRVVAVAQTAAGATEPAQSAWREAHALYAAVGVDAGVEEAREELERLAQDATQGSTTGDR